MGRFGGSADLDWILSNLWSWLIVGHSSPCASHIPPMCQPILMAKPRSKGEKKKVQSFKAFGIPGLEIISSHLFAKISQSSAQIECEETLSMMKRASRTDCEGCC